MIKLTPRAVAHFGKLLQPGQCIVFGTKRSGCSGLSYQLEISTSCDHIRYQKVPTESDLSFWVEKKSLPYLKGLVIDMAKAGLQSKIVYNNPNEVGQCGCGESFAVNADEH